MAITPALFFLLWDILAVWHILSFHIFFMGVNAERPEKQSNQPQDFLLLLNTQTKNRLSSSLLPPYISLLTQPYHCWFVYTYIQTSVAVWSLGKFLFVVFAHFSEFGIRKNEKILIMILYDLFYGIGWDVMVLNFVEGVMKSPVNAWGCDLLYLGNCKLVLVLIFLLSICLIDLFHLDLISLDYMYLNVCSLLLDFLI